MIYRSPHAPLEIPTTALPQFILEHCQLHGDQPALIDGVTGAQVSYSELIWQIKALAYHLQKQGLQKGEVVLLMSANHLRYPCILHAVTLAGGILSPINPLATVEDVTRQLQSCRPSFAICAGTAIETLKQALAAENLSASLAPLKQLWELDTPAFENLLREPTLQVQTFHAVSIDAQTDLAILPYSSGTSGLPKGVMLSHFNMVANVLQNSLVDDSIQADRILAVLPFFHIYGMTVFLNLALYRGATLVILPRFEAHLFLDAFQRFQITKTYLAPPLILFLAHDPQVEFYDFSSLRSISVGAAPLDAPISQACQQRLQCEIRQGYGLTETAPTVMRDGGTFQPARAGSIGLPCPNTEIRLVHPENGLDISVPATPGEIWIRGPQVMLGYLNNPEATANAFAQDGWFKSGDLATVDADGYFHIVDRLKEMIKYQGYQIAPSELEAYLRTHPAVQDVAVIAGRKMEIGEIPKAYVVLKNNHAASAQELIDFVAAKVAPYKKIRALEFINAIPKSVSGKILRRLLVEHDRNSTFSNF